MLTISLVKPLARSPSAWRSIRNYAENIAESAEERFVVRLHGAKTEPLRVKLPGARRELRSEVSRSNVVHLTHQLLSPHIASVRPLPTVITLHDFIPMLFASKRVGLARVWAWTFARSARALDGLPLLFANSECTARDAHRELDIDRDRIRVVPVSVSRAFYQSARPSATLPNVPEGPVVLSVGTGFPNKNLPLLLAAMSQPDLHHATLVRVGTALSGAHAAQVSSLGIGSRVVELGELPLDGLLSAMARATVLAQPSIYEGFGMPVAEAMAFGLPVVCSDGGALPEVAAEAARVVHLERRDYGPMNHDDVRNFAQALASIIDSPQEQERLRLAGFANVRRFHPDTIGPQLLDGYNEVIRRWS